jgi:Mor family transcriptional regulator
MTLLHQTCGTTTSGRLLTYGMVLFYIGQSAAIFPLTDYTPTMQERNEEIGAMYASGSMVGCLAKLFNISEQRVSQIVKRKRS